MLNVNPSDELIELSKEMLETIMEEDKEYEFRRKGIIVRTKAKLVGISPTQFEELIESNEASRKKRFDNSFEGVEPW